MSDSHVSTTWQQSWASPAPSVSYGGSSDIHGISLGAFKGASTRSPDVADWQPPDLSADSALLPDLTALRSRSADLMRNNGLVSGAYTTFVDTVLGGAGLRLQPKPNWRELGWEEDAADEWSRHVAARWQSYSEGTSCHPDAGRRLRFAGLSRLVLRSVLDSGEALALPLWLERPWSDWRTCFQLVDSARLSNPFNQWDTPTLRGGIETDVYGAPVAYNIRKAHPGDGLWLNPQAFVWDRVEAFTPWGRPRVLHVFEPERIGQRRGKPAISAVLSEMHTFGRYTQAELRSALVNSLVAAILESPMDGASISDLFGNGSAYVTSRQAYWDNHRKNSGAVSLRDNLFLRTFPGEKFTAFAPARPVAAYGQFVESLLRNISTGLNLPYELVAKDFSKTNYSSARAAILEGWRHFTVRRLFMAAYWYQPCYEMWLEEEIANGSIVAPGFYQNRDAYVRARWIGPGRGWVDPVKEATAAGNRMALQISTLESEAAEQGEDWEAILDQLSREQRAREKLGLNAPPVVVGKSLEYPTDEAPPPEEGGDGNGAGKDDGNSDEGETT